VLPPEICIIYPAIGSIWGIGRLGLFLTKSFAAKFSVLPGFGLLIFIRNGSRFPFKKIQKISEILTARISDRIRPK
jgi:hypothetical protein